MQHQTVSRDEWLAARKELLRKEKEFTRLRDQLSAERRALPWVKVEKNYVFDGPNGKVTPRRPVRRTQPACRQALHVRPRLDGRLRRLLVRTGSHRGRAASISSTTTWPMPWSRARRWRRPSRSGSAWAGTVKWVSSYGSDFNHDFHVSFTPEEIAAGKATYNYRTGASVIDEMSGRSVFYKDEDGQIFHTYSSFARGGEMFLGSYAFLDITPKGRDETINGNLTDWVRHHDRYDDATGSCCH